MDNPGVVDLGDFAISTAGEQDGDWVTDLEGILSAQLQVAFAGGTGGTKVTVFIQTSFDQGKTPVDIACFTFANTAITKVINLSALTPRTSEYTPLNKALADDTSVDGLLGDRFRVCTISTGTYSGSTAVAVRMQAH